MSLSTITARVDSKDKIDFDTFCANVGLNTSTAINLFVKAVLRENRIPFEIVQDSSFYSEKNMKALEHSKTQMENGQHSIHELVEV